MKLPEICIPPQLVSGDLLTIVSMSGGKDSTATALVLKEAGIEARYVFADTGWEAPETYARATDPSGRRYAALVAEHARQLATEAP